MQFTTVILALASFSAVLAAPQSWTNGAYPGSSITGNGNGGSGGNGGNDNGNSGNAGSTGSGNTCSNVSQTQSCCDQLHQGNLGDSLLGMIGLNCINAVASGCGANQQTACCEPSTNTGLIVVSSCQLL